MAHFNSIAFAKENGIKPIIGCEIYVARKSRFDKDAQKDRHSFHMTILARNLAGYKNLMKIVTIGQLEGMYYKPRVDHEILKKYGEGLIATSGCLAGEIPKALMDGRYEKAKKLAIAFQSYFGKDYFFLEIQRNGMKEMEILNPLLEKLAASYQFHWLQRVIPTISILMTILPRRFYGVLLITKNSVIQPEEPMQQKNFM